MSIFGNRSFLITLVTLVCCAALLGIAYVRGLQRGMEAVIEWGPDYAQNAIAIAISDLVYNFNLGYVAAGQVTAKLWNTIEGGATPGDLNILPRLHDADLINRAIKEASELGTITPGYVDQGGLISMYFQDLGYVDFIKLAFRLFGMQIQSLYLLFFVLFGLSVGLFIITFKGNLLASVTIVAITFTFLAEINSTIFDENMPTVYGLRYPGTLAIVPTVHLMLLIVWRLPPSFWNVVLTIPQAALLVFAIKLRSPAQWGMIAIAAIVGISFLAALWKGFRLRQGWELATAKALPTLVRWPLILMVALMIAHSVYMRAAVHPVYDSDDTLTSHNFWDTLFMDYAAFDEDARALSDYQVGQEIGYNAGRIYAKQQHLVSDPAHLGSALTGTTLRIGFNDQLMRRIFLRYFSQHPLRVLRGYLIENPIRTTRIFLGATLGIGGIPSGLCCAIPSAFPSWVWVGGLAICFGFAAALTFLPWDRAKAAHLFYALAVIGVASALPLIMITPNPIIYLADVLIVWPAALYVTVPLLIGLIVKALIAQRIERPRRESVTA